MKRLPRPRPLVQLLGAAVAGIIALMVGWVVLVQAPPSAGPISLTVRVVLFAVVAVGVFRLLAARYSPLSTEQLEQLNAATLCHYTTAAAAAQIMNVDQIPAAGIAGDANLASRQNGRLTIITTLTAGRDAVYAWTGPLTHPCLYVGNANTVITFRGADLPNPTDVRWRPEGAVRIPGGYTGPATATPIKRSRLGG